MEEELKLMQKESMEINTGSTEVMKRFGIDLMPKHINQLCREKDREIFKLACIYQAKTEIYDRTLTSRRSYHDPTEAFLDDAPKRSLSNRYACRLREIIVKFAVLKLKMNSDEFRDRFRQTINNCHYSAQGWIDIYNNLKENGEMDFFETWFSDWKPIDRVTEIGEHCRKIEV